MDRQTASTRAIREAEPGDASTIAEVVLDSRLAARRGLYDDDYLDALRPDPSPELIRAFIVDPVAGWHLWVAEEDGVVVGFAKAGPWEEDPTGTVADLDELYVASSHFRRGIGRALLDAVEAELAAQGCTSAVNWVLEEDPKAQAFYRAVGWRPGDRSKQLQKDRPRQVRLWHKSLSASFPSPEAGA